MGERHGVPIPPVMHAEDPAAAAGLDTVDCIAGHVLQHRAIIASVKCSTRWTHLWAVLMTSCRRSSSIWEAVPEACTM